MNASARNVLFAALLVAACGSCALPPPAHDIELGAQVAAATEADVGLYGDAELQEYVRAVAGRVAANVGETPFEYRFGVLDQPEPNAFAAPGGFVYVSRGLLALAMSEDELAAVLGHEIVHVERRHAAQAMRPRPLGSILSLPGRAVGLILPTVGGLVNAPIDAVRALRQASYSRGQEDESDRLGQELAAAAGYEPAALGPILGRMQRVVEAITGERRRASYFDSHPATPDRVQKVAARAAELVAAERPADARGGDAFVRALDGLVWGSNPARGRFEDAVFLDAVTGVAITFPVSWRKVHTAALAGAVGGERAVVFRVAAPSAVGIDGLVGVTVERFEAEGLEVVSDEVVAIGGWSARVLGFREAGGGDGVVLQAFVDLGGVIAEFLALGPGSARGELLAVIRSLRGLTAAERESFVVTRVRVVEAVDGETIAELVARVGGDGGGGLVAALNDVEAGQRLAGGRLVKVLRSEAFP